VAKKYPYDVLLAGIGVGGLENTTISTMDLLRKARVVFSLSVHTSRLRGVCRNVVDLDDQYFTGESDNVVYTKLTRLVLQEAVKEGGVALVDDGHPLIYDDVCQAILGAASRKRLRAIVLPAISSIDAMVANLGVRFDPTGFQVVEANTLVERRQRLNPEFETLVMQLGWFGVSKLQDDIASSPERFLSLQKHLLRFYEARHRVRILRAALGAGDAESAMWCRLDRLHSYHERIAVDATLYVPAIRNTVSRRGSTD